jgi:hypothetical protein
MAASCCARALGVVASGGVEGVQQNTLASAMHQLMRAGLSPLTVRALSTSLPCALRHTSAGVATATTMRSENRPAGVGWDKTYSGRSCTHPCRWVPRG